MKIIYKNESFNIIHPNQLDEVSLYYKEFIDSRGLVKREELISKNKIVKIEYYVEQDETNESILDLLAPFDCTIVLIKREAFDEFLIEHEQVYRGGELKNKYNQLFLGKENLCSEEICLSNGLPLYEYTDKSLYFKDESYEDASFSWKFHYKEDGSLEWIEFSCGEEEQDDQEYNPDELRTIFKWPEWKYEYYSSAKLLPNLELFHQAKKENNNG